MSDVVQTFWGFCHTLRHDGIDYGDYIEQITYLLFLKMADERGIDLSRIARAEARTECSWRADPGHVSPLAGAVVGEGGGVGGACRARAARARPPAGPAR